MAVDWLQRILASKRAEVAAARRQIPESRLADVAGRRPAGPSLAEALLPGAGGRPVNIIAEIKRASPSKGDIRSDLDAGETASAYAQGGAAAVSVLTDTPFFKGSAADLQAARRACDLPLLRKDFVISAYQIYEAAVWGADAVLLIVRILEKPQLVDFLSLCRELRLDALVEIYDEAEVETAAAVGARLVGINNRNLKTFATDLGHAARLSRRLAPGQIAVAASGVRGPEDIAAGRAAGLTNFLIGESLVRAADPIQALRALTTAGSTAPAGQGRG